MKWWNWNFFFKGRLKLWLQQWHLLHTPIPAYGADATREVMEVPTCVSGSSVRGERKGGGGLHGSKSWHQKKKIKQALGKAGNEAQSGGCWPGMHEALGWSALQKVGVVPITYTYNLKVEQKNKKFKVILSYTRVWGQPRLHKTLSPALAKKEQKQNKASSTHTIGRQGQWQPSTQTQVL